MLKWTALVILIDQEQDLRLLRLFEFPEVGCLGDSDASAAVVLPAAELGVKIAEDGVKRIIEQSD